jgi:hypothetical protein
MNPGFSPLIIVWVAFAVLSGCERSSPVKTPIPGTALVVALEGPDEKQHYRYSVIENGAVVARRFIGPAKVDSPINPKVTDDGQGQVTVRWGSGREGAWATIDTNARRISADANLANSPEPFRPQP